MKRRDTFLLIDFDTGAMDGFYFEHNLARDILKQHKAQGGNWCMVRVVAGGQRLIVPDSLWWTNIPKYREALR